MLSKNHLLIIPGMKVADIILDNPYIMLMMEHFGLRFVLQDKTLEQFCEENKINQELFMNIANLFNGQQAETDTEYSFKDIHLIIRYLKNSHQYYLKEKYPQIRNYIKQVFEVNDHPEILMLEKFFDKYFKEVSEHLNYEDDVVFPYVVNLYKKISNEGFEETVKTYSVKEYREHHDDIEEKLTDLKNLLIKYLPQKNDSQLRRMLLFSLFELEYDLNIHSRIEDTILIPLVERMEKHAENQ
jgi:regulator of cell morphogenesis and NO signaling